MWQGKVHGHQDFTRICLPAQEQRKEIRMSDFAGSMADGIMASKALEVGQRDSSYVRASWGRSYHRIIES